MVTRSNQSNACQLSELPVDRWRCFLLDLVCGLLTAMLYTLMRAERATLSVLHVIENVANCEASRENDQEAIQSVPLDAHEAGFLESFKKI